MLYLNQLDYGHLTYNHNMDNGGPPEGRNTVRTSGCGLCCACMMVDHLTTNSLSIEDCVKLSETIGANRGIGTDMKILADAVCEEYGLEVIKTNSVEQLITHLQSGGEAIIHVSGDREGEVGLFTFRGHYIAAISYENGEVCILDPSYKEGKFDVEGRVGKVRVSEPFIYCDPVILAHEASNRNPSFYLFKRKTNFKI